MSTCSTLSRRSASLIATSAFDWLSPSTCTILYLPSTPPRRVQWHPGALDPERPREEAPHLAPDHREGWAAAAPPDRIEAREEPAAGSDDRGHRADVLGAARGVDRAEARVLPHALERVGVVAAEGEDVTLLELCRNAVRLRAGLRRGDRRRREVEAHGPIAAAGQVPHVVAAPAPGDRDAAGRQRRGLHELHERRRGLAELPAIAAAGGGMRPELGGAHAGQCSPSKSSMTESAPAAPSSAS